MDQKFTIRDILVYFITGFLFFLIFTITYSDFTLPLFQKYKEFISLLNVASIVIFYFLGHLVYAIDVSVFSNIGRLVNKLHQNRPNFFTSFWDQIFNGHRIRGILKKYWKIDKEFVDVVSKCCDSIQYNEAMYWSYLNDSFKGYTLIFFIFSLSGFFRGNLNLGLIWLLLTILFRQRGRFFGIYHVEAIGRIYNNKNNK